MKKSIWRSTVVAATVGALAIGMVPSALAGDPINVDTPVSGPIADPATVGTWRIAGNTRIQTAIEAAKTRTDWGRFVINQFDCTPAGIGMDGAVAPPNYAVGDVAQFNIFAPNLNPNFPFTIVQNCTVVAVNSFVKDIIIARDDDYPDALAAGPLADVTNAPVLLNPTDAFRTDGGALNSDVEAYIETQRASSGVLVVHLLGGTSALSQRVQDQLAALGNDVVVVRHQGADRYQTAVGIAQVTIFNQIFNWIFDGAPLNDVPQFGNVYLATGLNYPDALASGAGASANSGVVLLTKGDEFDKNPNGDSFTYTFIQALPTTILNFLTPIFGPNFPMNTPEVFGVGTQASTAAKNSLGSILAETYEGINRYETAALLAEDTFSDSFAPKHYFAVASGTNYPDGVVAGGYIANLDGPLLLSDPTDLYRAFGDPTGNPYTADYLQNNANNSDLIFVFGGTGSLNQNVQDQIEDVVDF